MECPYNVETRKCSVPVAPFCLKYLMLLVPQKARTFTFTFTFLLSLVNGLCKTLQPNVCHFIANPYSFFMTADSESRQAVSSDAYASF